MAAVASSLALLAVVFLACACADGAGAAGAVPRPAVRTEPITYTGPSVETRLERMESQPIQYALDLSIGVPTGGFALVHDATETEDGKTAIRCTLTTPGADEVVTQALETKTLRVSLASTVGKDKGSVLQLFIRRVRRGEVAAAAGYELAKIIEI